MELEPGKVAVVTGAGSGIGLGLARAFAAEGLAVVLADVQEDALAAAAEQVSALGVEVLAVRTDVSVEAEVQHLAAATVERFGAVHVVCNNAGVSGGGDPWTGPLSAWEWTFGVNLWGVVHGVRAFLPHLVAAGEGHVVNTASIAGLLPGFGAAYDASKHAVVALTEGLHTTLSGAGLPVGVSCLCPGWVKTGIMDAERNWPAAYGTPPPADEVRDVMARHVRRAIDEGMQPGAVADLVVGAVREGRFWVFPHPDFLELAIERFHRIAEGLDPVATEQTPGLPPRSALMAEVQALLEPPAGG